ncbi:hypothetical protein EO763_12435 [Pectobacterium odoriferum]|uniref:hypothetical protein n=1 Tax=Pectobacterium odoriferum TaxID=78398 RepID=UPI001373BB44|nr:hypothetical protein [Pectobacterium odoriferum]QHP80672.1 hypothetical protein EO763_12435 [Pectobacterium odoriferum]
MKERGIIFNGDMVRATLSGQKTQTRRIVKPQPDEDGLARLSGGTWMDTSEKVYLCPFGKVGDRLWVRETFNGFWLDDDVIQEIKDGISKASEFCDYRSDYPDSSQPVGGWTPSIHMPRWASRITREIIGVRVERLNDISEEDCWAEGIDAVDDRFENAEIIDMAVKIGCCIEDAKPMFALLWQSIYGAESWDANPWVWVIEFKHIKGD